MISPHIPTRPEAAEVLKRVRDLEARRADRIRADGYLLDDPDGSGALASHRDWRKIHAEALALARQQLTESNGCLKILVNYGGLTDSLCKTLCEVIDRNSAVLGHKEEAERKQANWLAEILKQNEADISKWPDWLKRAARVQVPPEAWEEFKPILPPPE